MSPCPRDSNSSRPQREELAARDEDSVPADLDVGDGTGLTGDRNVDAARTAHLHTLHVDHLSRVVSDDGAVLYQVAAEWSCRASRRGIFNHTKTRREHPAV